MKGIPAGLLAALVLVGAAVGQNATGSDQATTDEANRKTIAYAVQAISGIRSNMHDPSSFELLQALVFTRQQKNGRTSVRGCIHYMGTNLFGGRLQVWGFWGVNKKGQLGYEGGTESNNCLYLKDEVKKDITDEVRKLLSAQ